MKSPMCGGIERLDEFLKLLVNIKEDDVRYEKLTAVANEAIRSVSKLRSDLKVFKLEELAESIRSATWSCHDTSNMQKYFLGDGNEGSPVFIKEILLLVGKNKKTLINAINWVQYLDAEMKPMVCETLFNTMEVEGLTDDALIVLPLLQTITHLPLGMLDDIRVKLEFHSRIIIDRFVKAIKEKNHMPIANQDGVYEFYMQAIVHKFDLKKLENVLLLIEYNAFQAKGYSCKNVSSALFSSLVIALEENLLLDSEQALHLYAHAKFLHKKGSRYDDPENPEIFPQLFHDMFDKLTKMKYRLFKHYQRYIEDPDKKKIATLHIRTPDLDQILNEFVTWYFNSEAVRTNYLLAAARCIADTTDDIKSRQYHIATSSILEQLHEEMVQKQQMDDTFETFCLFHEIQIQKLRTKIPHCVQLLLSQANTKQVRLFNKFFVMPLCVQQGKVCCTNSENQDEQLCTATVDKETALTTFTFKSNDTCWQLDASDADGVIKVAQKGSQWKLKAVDQYHFKIFTENDKFLTVEGKPMLEDNSRRSICLKNENRTEMQLWKIETLTEE